MLIFFGRSGLSDDDISELKQSIKGRADVIFAGEMSAPEISKVIQTLDLGLATSPWEAIQIPRETGLVPRRRRCIREVQTS